MWFNFGVTKIYFDYIMLSIFCTFEVIYIAFDKTFEGLSATYDG